MARNISKPRGASVLVLGVGSFAHSIGQTLKDAGAKVATYLTRDYGHFPPSLVGPVFSRAAIRVNFIHSILLKKPHFQKRTEKPRELSGGGVARIVYRRLSQSS